MRYLFALPGLHRVNRGAEVALESVARQLAIGGDDVVVVGSGRPREGDSYEFRHAAAISREHFERRWPKPPLLSSEYMYEELTFVPGLLRSYRPREVDVTLTCGYPYSNWVLRRGGRHRPRHVFVTQNGDWPAFRTGPEARWFGCDGLVCINPTFEARQRDGYRCALIPNGIDPDRFSPGTGDRARFGIHPSRPLVLVVSALIGSKRVDDVVRVVAGLDGVDLLVAGDGPERDRVDALGSELLGERYRRMSVDRHDMPELYRCADAVVHLSPDEPFGNVYVEAMASGLPVVAHDTEATRWIFGQWGTLLDTSDLAAVRVAVSKVLAGPDPGRDDMSAWVRGRYGWPAIAREYRRFCEDVVATRGS